MSLREKLAAKQRRRATYPVQVSDPGQAAERVAAARQALVAAEMSPTTTREQRAELEHDLEAAQAAHAEHFVAVEFLALHPADFEALFAAHLVEDAKGEAVVDATTLLPALAAACAVDEELQDAEWWAGQLDPEKGTWTKGERDALYYELFTRLHYSIPRDVVSKG